jgi:hypothetical protein
MNCNKSPHTKRNANFVGSSEDENCEEGIPITTTNNCVHCGLSWNENRQLESVCNNKLKITVFLDMLPCSVVDRY